MLIESSIIFRFQSGRIPGPLFILPKRRNSIAVEMLSIRSSELKIKGEMDLQIAFDPA